MSDTNEPVAMVTSSKKLNRSQTKPLRGVANKAANANDDNIDCVKLEFSTTHGTKFTMKVSSKHRQIEPGEIDQLLTLARGAISEGFTPQTLQADTGDALAADTDIAPREPHDAVPK